MSSHSSAPTAPSVTPSPSNTQTPTAATPTPSPTSPTNTASPATPSAPSASPSGSSASTSSTSSSTTATPLTTPTVVSSGGTIETITQVITPTVAASPSSQNNASSNSFFHNTGAVAGVFTVVGLVVIGLVIALIINCVRRRRAEKFDRDVAQAAAEAAASSRSPFEEYSYNNTGGGGGGGGYGYSGDSHGTYQLPPMQPNDTYGMSEMSQYDPYTAGAASMAAAAAVDRSRSRKESEPGAPGIAGVGARGLAREPSSRAPYHAFAGPPHELQGSGGTLRSPRSTNQDVLEAVGLAGPSLGPYPSMAPSNPNPTNLTTAGAYVTRKPSDTTQNTHVSGRSQFGAVPATLQPGYPIVDSYYPQRHESHSPDPFAGYPPQVMPPSTTTLPNPHDATLPSPSSVPGNQSDHNEDADLGSVTALRSAEQRLSYQDDTDYSQGNRVLRVANE